MLGREGFKGTRRFVDEGRLGAGGMGVVHRARDLERGEIVALKTMMRLEPEALLRFKKEFRALADISHPNVVQLYELFSEGEQWFFTMELLDGVDLLTWVQSSLTLPPPPTPPEPGPAGEATMQAGTGFFDSIKPAGFSAAPSSGAAGVDSPRAVVRKFPVRDVGRLRDAFRQLAAGLMAIHASGKLHRDVKPPNVLVTRAGRVVLLDFGVASDLADRKGHGVEYSMAGTPAYMAPEQATLARATPASDWYAVGVVLYEALATRLPFEGSAPAIIFGKQHRAPPPPSAHVAGVPEDLELLAMDLLKADPRERPTGEEVLARLEGERSTFVSSPGEVSFVGRLPQLEELRAAYRASVSSLGVVMLHGPSGMGKTALATRFLSELAAGDDALVLSGRCYERETVPFKAVDPVVDELRHWLARLEEGEAGAYLPPDLAALARVFPVLGDLDAAGDEGRRRPVDHIEPHELRRRAFAAMKELLTNIARHHRLVIHIDDLQWCDADSVQLLEALFAPPSPPWLLVCTYRSELGRSSAALTDLRRAIELLGAQCTLKELELSELAPYEAEELARKLVGSREPGVAALVTAEACGNPLFLGELARWANERLGTTQGPHGLSLDQVILDRVARLPDEARTLLETLSVAGGPLTHAVAARASELASRLRTPALALRSARLVVTRGMGDDDAIEPAHARVRETIAQSLGEQRRRACHAGIARALAEETPRCDPEAIFTHFRAAGDDSSAKGFVLAAAEAADRSLAFLRAAALYREAIDLAVAPLDVLHRKLGDAYANAGRLALAADAYLAGARYAKSSEALELRRLAAEDYLKSGRVARGVEVLRSVLEEVDLPYPQSTQRAIASLLFNEARLRVAPLRRRLRSAQSVDAATLARIDVAFAASTALSLSDPLRGADYASRGLLLALEASEPVRLCRALAVAAGNTATRGERGRSRAEELVRASERIAEEIEEPHARALALLTAGTVHFLLGEWRSSRSKLERAEQVLRESCRAVSWELANTQTWTCNVLILSGELSEASRRVPALMDEARSREDRFAIMHLAYPACIARIVADDVVGAADIASIADTRDSSVITAGRWGAFISACSVDRYRGDGASAWRRVTAESASLESSLLWQLAMVRTFSCYECGLSALSAATSGYERKRALAAAHRWAKMLAKEKLRYAPALGHLLRAGAAAADRNRGAALDALDSAIPQLDEADLGYLAACARHRKGELVGGAVGHELLERSRAFFKAQGIVNTERCLAMSAPGF